MNAFTEASMVETHAMRDLIPWIENNEFINRYVITNKGKLSKELQKSAGDILYNSPNDTIYGIEIKAECENKYNNFFLETWSNRSRFTLGWMYNLKTDFLFYYFLETRELYIINFQKLREWAFWKNEIYKYPEKKQNKYDQLNDTFGRCVPIDDIVNEEITKYIQV